MPERHRKETEYRELLSVRSFATTVASYSKNISSGPALESLRAEPEDISIDRVNARLKEGVHLDRFGTDTEDEILGSHT